MLRGLTPPFTPRGAASLVAPPPWHYAGWLLNVEFECDRDRAAAFVPRELGAATGRGTVHFADWQATTDGSELIDPILSQYRETIVLLELARPDGPAANFCPLIYVDQDVSMLRGLLQGWPKKFGSTWLTRSLPLDHPAAAPLRAGTRLGASLAVKDRRLVEARLELTGREGAPLGFLARPTYGTVGWADLTAPERPPELRYVRPAVTGAVSTGWSEARAELTFLPDAREELSDLGLIGATRASAGYAGVTITGATPA
ncbi:acetoacetate decarboxylase family protein [Anaeromyxobacter paludicola]|uniref:Acetoacetate decarboxylase n=1 Tax=Anaeromyxobacter paludicola TaxID=2918171 RepID=A0ABN6NBG4_9BACT|nr:acetoacetate decarboxylase family protein [Anaeromyxobacter paludicola]BDG10571.1 acetoacetate decarboxylase [Anaeromyxobacter paludicola]